MLRAGVSVPVSAPRSAGRIGTDTPVCTNCGSATVAAFCAECGERRPSEHDYSLRRLLGETFHELTSIDGRLIRSIGALLTRPGMLTREWFAGRRGRYVRPLQLFVVLNLVFFITQPHTGLLSYKLDHYVSGTSDAALYRAALTSAKRAEMKESPDVFAAHFNDVLQDQKKSLLAVCIPVFALALAITYVGRARYFAEHLVFSLHHYTFFLVFFTIITPLSLLVVRGLLRLGLPGKFVAPLGGEPALLVLIAVVVGAYVYKALRRVYGDGPLAALSRATVLVVVQQCLIVAYHDLLFYTTLYSL